PPDSALPPLASAVDPKLEVVDALTGSGQGERDGDGGSSKCGLVRRIAGEREARGDLWLPRMTDRQALSVEHPVQYRTGCTLHISRRHLEFTGYCLEHILIGRKFVSGVHLVECLQVRP
ncbi:MAG: hypothetical protein PVF87_07330, partial [Acidimicrobiia bacterium]